VTRPGNAVTGVLGGDVRSKATFSISFWFQVADFDVFLGFFSLCHFIFFRSYLFGLFVVRVVSVTPKGI
jgi:hypothetical protein